LRWGWLLFAVAVAGFLLVRRRRLGRLTLFAGIAVVVAAGLIGTGVIELPNLEQLLADAGKALGKWTYLLVGVLAFLETGAFVGLVAPGETTVIVGGVVAGQGEISLLVLIAIVWTCAVAGDLTSYTLGRRLGREWLVRHGERVKITEDRLRQVEGFFDRYGGVTILIGRFIGLVRSLAPFVAGTANMPLRTFLPYDVLGAGLWSTTFCVLGYVFWHSFGQLTTYVSRGLLAFGTVVVIGAGLVMLVQLRRDEAKRERLKAWLYEREDRPGVALLIRLGRPVWRGLLRPAAAAIDAAARFARDRLTPGQLGLELTTLLALGFVGAFGFMLLGEVVRELGVPRIDRAAHDLAGRIAFGGLTEVAKVVTELGSLAVVALVVLATALWALRRRHWLDAAALTAGLALSYVAVHEAKAAYDRSRPEGGLTDAALSSYPSGHALYAVAWLACAMVLVRAGSGWAVRFAAVTLALAIVAAVGLTRVYLRVHHLTDVLGGIGLGLAIWAMCGIVALVAGHVRHNVAPRP
jgi:membrane protein DedA with SNARE-associated domain/membrane-associated phospholipid phosphatase